MSERLEAGIQAIAERLPGTWGVAIQCLPDGPAAVFNADRIFPTASVIKVPVQVEVFAQAAEQRLDLHSRYELQRPHRVEGSGVLQ